MTLLINTPSGQQELITVGEGGGYFDLAMVVWDERTDGILPNITLGGMVRENNELIFNKTRMDLHLEACKTINMFSYQAQRAAEYPPMADYVDGVVKGDTTQVQAYIDACLAVKAKYPKPA